jgi:hypothetical protein
MASIPYAMISRTTSPIARIAINCQSTLRRGASIAANSRLGVPEPEAVTGSLLTSVEVSASIAEGPLPARPASIFAGRAVSIAVGLLLVLGAWITYTLSNPAHTNFYTHFVWQADAFLQGRVWFPFPVKDVPGVPDNWYFQDVFPLKDAAGEDLGRVLLPFPPLPAVLLMPFVALFGLRTDQAAISIGLAALGVGAAWWMLGGLRPRLLVRLAATAVFGLGTTWWWAAAVGSTWYLAHLVAVDLALLAVGVTLRHDDGEPRLRSGPVANGGGSLARRLRATTWPLDRSQVLAGFLLGLAATARLPLVFAAPWFMLVGGGGTTLRRTVSTAVGAVPPVAALLLYTYLTTGSLVHPGYEYQYQREANGYQALGYNPKWSVEDVRYIPHNLGIMLTALPAVAPDVKPNTLGFGDPVQLCTAPGAKRSLFDDACPLAVPVDIGTGILFSAPGLLLALLAFRRRWRTRLVLGASTTVLIIATFNLAHFSQGWVQWGYRFSLDYMPFLLPLVGIGAARLDGRIRTVTLLLVGLGTAVNLWGVIWGKILGW